jgi:hypothetical protein
MGGEVCVKVPSAKMRLGAYSGQGYTISAQGACEDACTSSLATGPSPRCCSSGARQDTRLAGGPTIAAPLTQIGATECVEGPCYQAARSWAHSRAPVLCRLPSRYGSARLRTLLMEERISAQISPVSVRVANHANSERAG